MGPVNNAQDSLTNTFKWKRKLVKEGVDSVHSARDPTTSHVMEHFSKNETK